MESVSCRFFVAGSAIFAIVAVAHCTLLHAGRVWRAFGRIRPRAGYLSAKYRALRARQGAPKAIKAMARHLACLMYRILRYGQACVDQGTQQSGRKRAQRELSSLQRKAVPHSDISSFNLPRSDHRLTKNQSVTR